MALYALGDLHLAYGADKPMDIFGGRWEGYQEKIKEGLSVLRQEDTLVIPGDFSWALDLQQAKADFDFIDRYPGRKLFVKGNHDYWWTTASKFTKFCRENGYENMELLHNNCHLHGQVALCGTRGWFFEEEQGGTHDEKVFPTLFSSFLYPLFVDCMKSENCSSDKRILLVLRQYTRIMRGIHC